MFQNEIQLLKKLSSYRIEIGVISENSNRKKDIVSIGVTNAELMAIHENGSPIRNIPARPVLDITIKWAAEKLIPQTIDKIVDGVFQSNWNMKMIDTELEKMCVRMQNHARRIIYNNDGTLAPNSPNVAKKKKGNHPLFDTGQLARSITCRLVKGN